MIGIVLGVPQGSILGPILFNIFINDMFFFLLETEVCNFADDNTLYIGDSCLDKVVIKLENDINRVIKWSNFNSMVVNPEKFPTHVSWTREKTKVKILHRHRR